MMWITAGLLIHMKRSGQSVMQLGRGLRVRKNLSGIPLPTPLQYSTRLQGGFYFCWGSMPLSTRDEVLLQGVLKGMKQEVPCTIRAIKVTLWTLGVREYVKAEVAQAPIELPDGDYQIGFEGRSMKVQKIAGHWEPSAL